MNYLAHAFLSFGDGGILTGNMIGDHVKGRVANLPFPDEIKKGITLHRKIDSYTDAHPVAGRAKLLFREAYGLYAGAITDSLFDHFLANDPKHFASKQHLADFATDTYKQLDNYSRYFPDTFRDIFPYMHGQNWLYGYHTLQGAHNALKGLAHRAKHMPPVTAAYQLLIGHYYQLAQYYYELMDDVIAYVKVELTRLLP